MSPRGQKKDPEIEVVDDGEGEVTPEQVQEADDFLSEPVNQEEFNEFITNLARNAAQQVVQDLEQRVKDLEMLVGQPQKAVQFVNTVEEPRGYPDAPQGYGDVPDYSRAHQSGDGTPWYTG